MAHATRLGEGVRAQPVAVLVMLKRGCGHLCRASHSPHSAAVELLRSFAAGRAPRWPTPRWSNDTLRLARR